MGISYEEFYVLSPVELYNMVQTANERREADFKKEMIHTRFEAWLSQYAARIEKLPPKPEEMIGFKWEEPIVQTVEEMKAIFYALAEAHKDKPKVEPKKKK